ncbi:hypothetical protein [Endozoicomonas sp.]
MTIFEYSSSDYSSAASIITVGPVLQTCFCYLDSPAKRATR